jgi:enamine deaminase RidA (YjgF/YER057c/UK114 family)
MDEDRFVPANHEAPDPVGLYQAFIRSGTLVAISAISTSRNGQLLTGKVGRDLDLHTAQKAARAAGENLIAVLRDAAGGDLSRVEQVLFVRGYVNAAEDFPSVHKVIDAGSELIVETLGNNGKHARTAIGCSTLPNNNAVTIEAMAIIADQQPS